MSWRKGGGGDGGVSRRWAVLLCLGSFCLGLLFTNRMWTLPEANEIARPSGNGDEGNTLVAAECGPKKVQHPDYKDILRVQDTHHGVQQKTGEKRKKLEEEKGIIIRFVIGHSAISGGIVDRAIEAEDRKHGDFMRIDHVEGYLALSGKTKTYFATAVSLWDADFYVKVDDDVHVNIATLGQILSNHALKPRVYIGCMKSGPVLTEKGVRYYEPEHWKFGEPGNKYFRHATGQLYAISKDLATYISINRHVLHKYINEDVSLGSWFIGLDVEHIDDRRLCCGTPPDCEWKAQAGNTCAASFDWRCSGICNSEGRIWEVHNKCAEGEKALWNATF
uniref:Hexosyltransferase n=1 Tax=Oryza nivara TaxID=4536 RepID=A0A0E0G1S0_ORYNI